MQKSLRIIDLTLIILLFFVIRIYSLRKVVLLLQKLYPSLTEAAVRLQLFCKTGVVKIFTKFTGKDLHHPASNFIKDETPAQVFSCEFCEDFKQAFCEFLKNIFLYKTAEKLLLVSGFTVFHKPLRTYTWPKLSIK